MEASHKSFFNTLLTPLKILCESLLQQLLSVPSWYLHSDVKTTLWNHASQALRIGRVAVLAHVNNSRHLVGDVFITLVGFSFFLHQFFSMNPWDESWYYTNWFYYLRTLRPWMMGMFATLAMLYYWPSKSKSVYIVFTALHSLCLLGFFHFAFLVYDYYSFHSVPAWSFWVFAFSIGTGFVLASDHLVYVFEHKIKGNHKRFVMLEEHKAKLDAETRQRMLTSNLNEYHNLYKNY